MARIPSIWQRRLLVTGGIALLLALVVLLSGAAFNRVRDAGRPADAPGQSRAGILSNALAAGPSFQATNLPLAAAPATNAAMAQGPRDALDLYRAAMLQGYHGTNRIETLLRALVETPGGPEIQLLYQALALRKAEALPIIKARLRTGAMWEKHMLTKFLRLCPWPETKDELLALAQSDTEHWLPRQGAVFALGALGDPSAGPAVAGILNAPTATVNLQMAAVSTLARIQFADAAAAIEPFTRAENIHLRLFAMRALAEVGGTVDRGFLLSCLRSEDYVVRQEASEALWKIDGPEVAAALQTAATEDFHEAVRDAAAQALLRRELAGRSPAEKADLLRRSLDHTKRLTRLWILRAALDEGALEGRRLVQTVAARDDFLGERAKAYLVLADSKTR